MHVQAAVDSYLAELQESGRGAHTLRGYRSDLTILIECASRRGGHLDADAIAAYLAWPHGGAPATRARRLSALRGLLRSCGRLDLLTEAVEPASAKPDDAQNDVFAADAPASRPRAQRDRAPDRLDAEAVLAQIPRHADRDQLLFGLLARLGLRPGEALALRREDFDESAQCLHVPGWGGARRRVLVDDRPLLMRLVNLVRTSGATTGPLFTAAGRDTPLRYQSVQARWARYCTTAGVVVHLADLRRLHAEELLAGGVPESVVRDRLGQRTGPLTAAAPPPSPEAGDEAIRAWHARTTAAARARGAGGTTGIRTRRGSRAG
jgi:integrase